MEIKDYTNDNVSTLGDIKAGTVFRFPKGVNIQIKCDHSFAFSSRKICDKDEAVFLSAKDGVLSRSCVDRSVVVYNKTTLTLEKE